MKKSTRKNTTAPSDTQTYPLWQVKFKGIKKIDLWRSFSSNLEYFLAKDRYTYTLHDLFLSLAYTIRERLVEKWIVTQQEYHKKNVKRIHYLSMEYLPGRLLEDTCLNLGVRTTCNELMRENDLCFEDICDQEPDQSLGNGGLGRLAACYLDSMATLQLPSIGYGIRYEFGIFKQQIVHGYQHEIPEAWLQFGNPWEIKRPEYRIRIKFYGRVEHPVSDDRKLPAQWTDTNTVVAIPFDTPVSGYRNNTVNTLRLWSAHATNELDLADFNKGDYLGACYDKMNSENISKILYPSDNTQAGKELRLKQQYFFSSASLYDIIRRYKNDNKDLRQLATKVVIQLNETHPAIAIPELMRILIDEYGLSWDTAWGIVPDIFAYTNHTLMPEALEKWSVMTMQNLLPRHMEIIFEINQAFLAVIAEKFPGDTDRLRRMSIIEEGPEQNVRMAFLAVVCSHSVNGVAALHTQLMITHVFRDFCDLWPEKFNNKTNGITQRRWLYKANQSLAGLISKTIGEGWIKDLTELRKLESYAENPSFMKQWRAIKKGNKKTLAEKVKKWDAIILDPDTLFDVQVKRIHEYKRQLLNILFCIARYNEIRKGKTQGLVPRTMLFAGKAAPGYFMAKLIIEFINKVAAVINNDPKTRGLLTIHFLPNYRVTLAEYIMPAADLSEQISTAGTEASGTGNMKFALNGALTIGTLDGANIEIREEVGEDNIFIFGLTAGQVHEIRSRGYNPRDYYNNSPALQEIGDMLCSGFFSPENPHLFNPICEGLLNADPFMVLADFDAYVQCQKNIDAVYTDTARWTTMSILNVARMGKFSSDRSILEYNKDIWGVKPVSIVMKEGG